MKQGFDLIIVGAGVVGAALACALRSSGLRIAVLDAREPPRFSAKAELDLRVFALSPASQRILDALGAWETIRATRVSPYTGMRVWDATGSGRIHFDCADVGEPALGYIVENRLILHALWKQLETARNITAMYPAQPDTVQFDADAITLTLQDGQRLHTRLLVAADGAGSVTRKLAGMETVGESYAQQAIVAHVRTEKSHRDTAWQRFLPTGPIALLPLQDGRVSVVWSLDEARAEEIHKLDDTAFCAAVTQASEVVLGNVSTTTPRVVFPLQRLHAREYVRPRFALIGDAAHAVHPLAGQGVNLGLLDMATLAEAILAAQAGQRDIGDLNVLRRYQRARKADNLAMIVALDSLKWLFSNDIAPLRLLRNAGLRAVDRFTLLKSAFMRRAMGLSGELPPLAR